MEMWGLLRLALSAARVALSQVRRSVCVCVRVCVRVCVHACVCRLHDRSNAQARAATCGGAYMRGRLSASMLVCVGG